MQANRKGLSVFENPTSMGKKENNKTEAATKPPALVFLDRVMDVSRDMQSRPPSSWHAQLYADESESATLALQRNRLRRMSSDELHQSRPAIVSVRLHSAATASLQ